MTTVSVVVPSTSVRASDEMVTSPEEIIFAVEATLTLDFTSA